MPSLLSLISKSGVNVLRCQRYTLDAEDLTGYSQNEDAQGESIFEVPAPDSSIQRLEPKSSIPTILTYFLDGSRRIQKVAEIVVGGRFFPMLAGQVGVAVSGRSVTSRKLQPLREYCSIQNVIALPDKLGDELEDIQKRINNEFPINFRVLEYDTSDVSRNPNELATAAILRAMLNKEIDTVMKMGDSGLLGPDRWLIRDGPLQFRRPFVTKAPRAQLFDYVIGISKSFNTNAPIKRGARPLDVGSVVKDLDLFDRTKCYKTELGENTVAFWYLRIHHKQYVPNPLDGVIKIERIAQPNEIDDDGLDRDLIDAISRHVFEERNVTPYGSDSRWANHIYPIYLTEHFLKSSFQSDTKFSGYFRERA